MSARLLLLAPLFALAVQYRWSYQLMNVEFLAVGYVFYGMAIGVDPLPRSLPHIGKLAVVLAAFISIDGESTWLEGATLIALYAVIATAFWWG